MRGRITRPSISVVVPTRNRAPLLEQCLRSLAGQTLGRRQFEVVVVDDGSIDDTARVCDRATAHMNLRYARLEAAGIAAAKNAGIFLASAPLLLFFDDDDLASVDLLARHVDTHAAHPAQEVAVLGYTTWAPDLPVTPLMRYVTDIAGFLFCYTPIRHQQWLDFTYFWGGRSSCKRALLSQHGIFNQAFTFGCEDIELAYRLTRFNLQVIHDRDAVQYMNRPVAYDDFCLRCERQGRAQWLFSRLHPEPPIQQYCQVLDLNTRWGETEPRLAGAVRRVRELETGLAATPGEPPATLLDELHALYRFTFDGFKLKGIVESARMRSNGHP